MGTNPPPPAPKPGKVKVYRALYGYTAQRKDELSFEDGDILYVLDNTSDSGWWQARCGKHSGLIPFNYVSEQAESIDFPLHEAAKRGNLSFLAECLENQVSVNSLDKSGSTALYWAAHSGHIEAMKTLLAMSVVNVNAQNKIGDTALHAAAWKGHADCIQLLLQNGAKSSIKNQQKKTAYDLSARNPEVGALLKRASQTEPPPDADDYGGTSSEGEED